MELQMNSLGRKGGVIWLITAVIIALIWQSTMELWSTFLISWVVVGIAWIAVKGIKRTLSRRDAIGAILAFLILGVIAGLFAIGFMKLDSLLFETLDWDSGVLDVMISSDDRSSSYLICIALSLAMAGIAMTWLISAILPLTARNNGINPFSLLVRSVKQIKSSWAIGPAIIPTGSIVVAAAMISYTSDVPMKIAMGLVIAYAQIRFMAYSERPQAGLPANCANDKTSKGNLTKRRAPLITLFILHLVFSLFYIALFSIYHGWDWKVASLYPLTWLSGGCIALLAWLFAQVRILYVLLIILITLACAFLLGMIVGIYDLEMLA